MAIAKIRADLERQIQSLEKMSERLLGVAGPRFEDKVKRDGQSCSTPPICFKGIDAVLQTLFLVVSMRCTMRC